MHRSVAAVCLAGSLVVFAIPALSQSTAEVQKANPAGHAEFGRYVTPECGCGGGGGGSLPTEISVAASPSSTDIGTPENIQAVVEPTQGGPTPTGEVDFYYGDYEFASHDLSNNEADVVLDTRHIPPGVIPIHAHYLGDDTFQGSWSNIATFKLVGVPNSVTSIAASPSSAHQGATVTLTADVQPRQGGSTPTGQVLFFTGQHFLGSANLKNTVASITLSTKGDPLGTYYVYAIYMGDNYYVSSMSGNVKFVITK